MVMSSISSILISFAIPTLTPNPLMFAQSDRLT